MSKSLLDYEEPMALCLGNIVFNTPVDPDVCLYYKGNKLQLDINNEKMVRRIGQVTPTKKLVTMVPYTLSEAKAIQHFHILICCKPEISSIDNIINYLYVPHNTPYKFYTLSGARQYNDNQLDGCTWNVTEEFLLDDQIIPDNTIIFLFNADFIQGLEVKSWPLNSNVRVLPSIVIKHTITPESIRQAMIEARLAGMDFDAIHNRYPQYNVKREHKTVVTIKP